MKKQINRKTLNVININLFEGQIELILESLELYAFNSRYVLNSNNMNKEIDNLVSTYEQVATILANSNKKSIMTNDNIRYLKMKREEDLKKSV